MKEPTFVIAMRSLLAALLLSGASLLLSSCSQGSQWITTVDWKHIDIHTLPGAEQYPDAEAIILMDEGTMETIGSGELRMSVFERHRVVKVLTSGGRHYANVVIPYGTGTDVENIQARTIAPNGTITAVKDADIFDVSLYPNYIFFSDQRARLFTMPTVEDGSILEYRYRLRVRGHTLWHSWSFQDRVPTLRSRFTLISPSEYPVTAKLYGISIEPRGTKMPAGFKQTLVWEARDVPPLKREVGMPAEREVEATLAIQPLGFRTWDDVARWYGGLAEPGSSIGPRIKAVVERITAGAADDRTRLQRIYEWVQKQVRYMAVEIGIGGFQPHAAEDVCTKLYGDCKDMSTLLCAMARQAGIDVRQALVSTWQNGRPDTTLASPLQFNHAIAYAPSIDGGIWMDATEKWCCFGELPWYDQGLPVLLVDKENKGRIVTTPRSSPEENCSIDEWNVRLDTTGTAFVKGASRFSGMSAVEERNHVSDLRPSDRRRWLEEYLARRCPGVVLDSLRIDGIHPDRDGLRVEYLFHSSMFAVRRDSVLILHPGWISTAGLSEYFRSPARSHPVRFHYGTRSELALTVQLPPGWKARTPSLSDSLQSDFGAASWNFQSEGPVVAWRSGHTFAGKDILPSRYREFQQFLDAMQARDLREIELVKAGKAEGPGGGEAERTPGTAE
jgi:transglutaminase-like putative cysteine protease